MSDPAAELRPETPAAEPQGAPSPDAPAEPSAYQKRKAREEERRAKAARAKAAREARKASSTPAAEPAADQAEDSGRTDAQREDDAAVFLSGVVFPVLGFLASLFGFRLADLTDGEAREDAHAWVPIARRYRWFDVLITWAGAPARLVRRVRAKATRAPAKVVPLRTEAPPK